MGKLVNINGMHMTTLAFPMEVLDIKTSSASDTFTEHDMDVMNLRFKLVYEGVNSNGDRFTEAELRNAYPSLLYKLVNWEHDEPNIGTITKATLVEPTDMEPLHVVCEASIMAWKYPDKADIIRASAELGAIGMEGSVGTSMECYFHDADYVIGEYETVIPMSEDTGELEFMRGRKLGGSLVSRELKGVVFGGAAVTENPAEKRARMMAVARNTRVSDGDELFAGLRETDFALSSLRMFPLDTREHVAASLQYFDSVAALIDKGREAEVLEAHERLMAAANEYGITDTPHLCFVCKEKEGNLSENPDSTEELEESEAKIMAGTDVTETEVIETEATEEETLEEVAEVEATEESEEVAEEAEAEAETEEAVEEAEAGEFDVQAAFAEVMSVLKDLVGAFKKDMDMDEQDASVEVEKDSAEATITDLQNQISDLKEARDTAEATLRGVTRMQKLTKAGIEIAEDEAESKAEFLANLDEAAWATYYNDICTASKVAAEDMDTDILDEALNLEDSNKPKGAFASYRSFWASA